MVCAVLQQLNGTLRPAEMEGYVAVVTPDESCDTLISHSLPVRQSVLVNDVCQSSHSLTHLLTYLFRDASEITIGLPLTSSFGAEYLVE